MCGRYCAYIEDDELLRIVEREKRGQTQQYFRRNEVFPGTALPVLYGSFSTVRAHLSTWGYPIRGRAGGENEADGSRTNNRNEKEITLINARAEEAENKPMFKNALLGQSSTARRILVLSSGYYEWKEEGGRKIRYRLSPSPSPAPLLLAGLEISLNEKDHRHLILTTSARGDSASVHPRAPLCIPREQMRPWLYDTAFAIKKLREAQELPLLIERCP